VTVIIELHLATIRAKFRPGSPSSEFPATNLTNFDLGKEKFKILGDQGLAYCLNGIGNEIRNV